MEINFSQKWIEDKVKEALGKDIITTEDIEKIKYMLIGDSFSGYFTVSISCDEPHMPYYNPWGGDEWNCSTLNGSKIINGFVDHIKADTDNEFVDEVDRYVFMHNLEIYLEEHEDLQEEESEDGEVTLKEQYLRKKQREKAVEQYHNDVIETEYCEEIEDDDEADDWFRRTRDNIYKDLHLFTGLKVLRLQEVGLADFSFLQDLKKLEVLELAESDIYSLDGIENLKNLKQFCFWSN